MAHIVFFTNRMTSVFNTNLDVGRRLHTAGHTTTFVAGFDVEGAVCALGDPAIRRAITTMSERFAQQATSDDAVSVLETHLRTAGSSTR